LLALVASHFALGLAAVLVVPSLAYRVLWTHLPREFGIAFGVTGLLSLLVVFWVAKELNQLMTDRPG
jgi:Na+(H+)/acetate symporter ActP